MNNAEVRKIINDFYLSHIFDGETGNAALGMKPMIVLLFLGEETKALLEDATREAFDTLLNIRPAVACIDITDEAINKNGSLKESLEKSIFDFNSSGYLVKGEVANIKLAFVALMHDPILKNSGLSDNLERFKAEIYDVQRLGMVQFNDILFYGVFDQHKTNSDFDYGQALKLVNRGSTSNVGLWSGISHLEKTILEESYDDTCRALAMMTLSDVMFPAGRGDAGQDSENYHWKSIALKELKLPEQQICSILISGYRNNFTNAPMNQSETDELGKDIETELFKEIEDTCHILKFGEWVKYLPRQIQPQKEITRGFIRKKTEWIPVDIRPAQQLIDQNDLDTVLTEGCRPELEKLCSTDSLLSVYEKALMDMTHLDSSAPRLLNTILQATEELKHSLEIGITQIQLNFDELSEELYFKKLFEAYAKKEKYETACDILESALTDRKFTEEIQKTVGTLKEKTDHTISVLETIRVNSYGGTATLRTQSASDNFSIKIGTPVKEACEHIDDRKLEEIITNQSFFERDTDRFLSTVESQSSGMGLGGICRDYGNIGTFSFRVFVNQHQNIDRAGMIVTPHPLFRKNTIEVLTEEEWSSQRCLLNYYKE